MSEKAVPRPRQVTFAAVLVITGSALVVLMAFQQVAALRSLETRSAVEDMLSQPGLSGLGIGVAEALEVLRVFAMVAAACSVVTAILGLQILKASRTARIGVGLAAVPPFLTGMFADWGLISSMVLAASVMLWAQPARNWFRGLPAPEPPAHLRAQRRPDHGPRPEPAAEREAARERHSPWGSESTGNAEVPTADEPRSYVGYGTHGASSPQQPLGRVGTVAQVRAPYTPERPQHRVPRRPGTVAAAAIVTWVGSGLVVLTMTLGVLVAVTAPDVVWDTFQSQPELAATAEFSGPGELIRSMVLGAVLFGGWALLAAALAGLVWVRRAWARYALLLSAGSTAGLCLLGMFGLPLLLVPFTLAVVAAYLLLRPESRAWFA